LLPDDTPEIIREEAYEVYTKAVDDYLASIKTRNYKGALHITTGIHSAPASPAGGLQKH
jgi:hypothetical protein